MTRSKVSHIDAGAPDPRLETAVRAAVLFGVALVMLLPGARAVDPAFGWMPLWLVAAPALAWWSLYRFRLPGRAAPVAPLRRAFRRRTSMPVRRHGVASPQRLPRAA